MQVFWETLTVKEHISIWRKIKVAGADSNYEINDVMTECDILEKANATAQNLSGGMQRKLQLAIAFVGGSQLCFIDEASSGLVSCFISGSACMLTVFRILFLDVISGISFPKGPPDVPFS